MCQGGEPSTCRPAAFLYLLFVSLGISSRCEQSQDGSQEALIDLHCHLLNQSHEVPEMNQQRQNSCRLQTTTEDRKGLGHSEHFTCSQLNVATFTLSPILQSQKAT